MLGWGVKDSDARGTGFWPAFSHRSFFLHSYFLSNPCLNIPSAGPGGFSLRTRRNQKRQQLEETTYVSCK